MFCTREVLAGAFRTSSLKMLKASSAVTVSSYVTATSNTRFSGLALITWTPEGREVVLINDCPLFSLFWECECVLGVRVSEWPCESVWV